MSLKEKLNKILAHYSQLSEQLSTHNMSDTKGFASLSKEYADLGEVAASIKDYNNKRQQFADAKLMMEEAKNDKELKDLAEMEYHALKEELPLIENNIKLMLLPKDKDDEKNVILEVRAGTGGEEAGLFAASLLRLYQRYAAVRGWQFELLNSQNTGIGGIKEASANITGKGVFSRLKYESGVHRVQRVPETESGGRVHTSAATVAVLPEAESVDIVIEPKDLKFDVFRSSGAGGQHVNTTDSAVRVTHIPTGVVVECQDGRSQHKNKEQALKVLRSRIYEAERRKKDAERSEDRKSQVGSGDRSERIRTYNFPQGRVSDHRINLTLYKINQIMEGESLDELIDALTAHDQAEKLSKSINK
ncbi:MAG TPA: peptide chain release factor 1 [Holosporales bacterium]|nr:peptide chain release factor 1 [Holosporales bacterium]